MNAVSERGEKKRGRSSYSIRTLVRYRRSEDILVDATECEIDGVASVSVVCPYDVG